MDCIYLPFFVRVVLLSLVVRASGRRHAKAKKNRERRAKAEAEAKAAEGPRPSRRQPDLRATTTTPRRIHELIHTKASLTFVDAASAPGWGFFFRRGGLLPRRLRTPPLSASAASRRPRSRRIGEASGGRLVLGRHRSLTDRRHDLTIKRRARRVLDFAITASAAGDASPL